MSDYATQPMASGEPPICVLVQDLIPLYLDNEVTPESFTLIRDHLQQCERCSGFLKGAQSTRAQMLREQQTIRAAQASGQSVSSVRQPITMSVGLATWIGLMVGSWMLGLFGIGLGILGSQPLVVWIGMALAIFGVAGLTAARQTHGAAWRMLSILTGVLGLWIWAQELIPGLSPFSYRFRPLGGLRPLIGTLLLAIGGWGTWLSRQPAEPGSPQASGGPHLGAGAAVNTAIGGMVAGAALVLLALLGAWLVIAYRYWLPYQLIGVALGTGSLLGLLQLNQQHGWRADWSFPPTKRRLMALVVLGSGMLWSLLIARSWGIGSTQFLLELGIGAALITAGAWWYQRNK